ncbi:MAG TPA: zinc-binding alcohol dehydrogenase family protein [Streptosporangiaceae bacterium]|nr:zinc-binding alcohol dehydrogenase family protein [Streptosporangiaceae bacterium]
MKAAVLHAFGEVPRWEEFPQPVPGDGEELIEVTAAPLNNIDRVRADGSHYSVRSGEYASGGLPAVPGVVGAGRLPGGRRVLFGSRCGTMARYSVASPQMTFPIPEGLDDAVAAAAWNPGMSAWLALGWRARLQPGQTVLVLGATGVTGKLAVQAARHFGAGRVIAAGRNQQVLDTLPQLGADATIQLGQPPDALAAAFAAQAGEHGYDLVLDYLWGQPTEIFLRSTGHDDAQPRSGRTRLLQAGDMAGPDITLPAAVLRSAGLEILGLGTGTMPPLDVITAMLGELLDLLAAGKLRIDTDQVPLSAVAEVWNRDQQGRRPVFIPS